MLKNRASTRALGQSSKRYSVSVRTKGFVPTGLKSSFRLPLNTVTNMSSILMRQFRSSTLA